MAPLVDLHDHSLPGVDDGAETLEESLSMLRGLYDLGYRRIALTPHVRRRRWRNRRKDLEPILERLREATVEAGMDDLDLRLGAENYLDSGFFDLLESGELIPLGDGGHVLVELPSEGIPPLLEDKLFEVQLAGLTPIIAHPERYPDLLKKRARIEAMRDRGILLQISVTSLAGKFGWRTKRIAAKLLSAGLCDLVATDVHSTEGVQQYVRPALARLDKLVGPEKAQELLSTKPNQVLGP